MSKGLPLPPEPKRPINFAPLMKPAPALAVWPPMPFRDAYRVGDKPGANWQTVAAGFGVPDVWDLIWFNFQTTDPREVNFYLYRYVGCWQSNDAKNFSFMGAEPGVIFIPPWGYKRPNPDPTKTRFLGMLSAGVAHFPYITYKNVHISRSSFETVGMAVRTGKIGIGYDPDLLAASKTKALVEIEWFDKAVEFDGKVQNPVLRLREAIRHDPTYITSWWTRYRDDGI
jgi:hypothetical protein